MDPNRYAFCFVAGDRVFRNGLPGTVQSVDADKGEVTVQLDPVTDKNWNVELADAEEWKARVAKLEGPR